MTCVSPVVCGEVELVRRSCELRSGGAYLLHMTVKPCRQYSREDLPQLSRQGQKISCKLKRRLWYFGILRSPASGSCSSASPPVPSPSSIPVRITSRSFGHHSRSDHADQARFRCLVSPLIECVPRESKTRRSCSVLYFNARSLKNKVDELSDVHSIIRT